MHARVQRLVLFTALVALAVGACSSGGGPTVSGQASSPASATATSAPAASSGSSPAAAPSDTPVTTPVASVSASGAKPQPSGTPCDWLDKTTIDAALGLSVGSAIPNVGDAKGKICTWLSKAPVGGITLAIVTQGEVDSIVTGYKALPGGQLVTGVGVKAAALYLAGKAPLPTHAQVFVDFGGWGLSVDVSGPTVTVDAAAQLAAAAVSH